MSYLVIGAGGLLALCLCGYGSAIATVLGAAAVSPGALPPLAPARGGRNEAERTRSTWASVLGFYNPLASTVGSLGSAALLFKGAHMIETGARATWSVGGDKLPRDLVDVSTLLRFLAVALLGWQGLRMLKTYASNPRAIADSISRTGCGPVAETAAAAATAANAVLGETNKQNGDVGQEQDKELLRHSVYVGFGIAALGGGMAITLLMRTGEEKIFDDVLKNARLTVAASLMGGAALGFTARLLRQYV